MSDPQQLDKELRDYLEKEPNLRREDRLAYLKSIFHKHFEISNLEHVVNRYDFIQIISDAKHDFSNHSLPINITNTRIDTSELPSLSIAESVFSYLNKMNLLKKLVKFDYTK